MLEIHRMWIDLQHTYFSIQPRCFDGANEKLRTIGIRSGIGHRKRSRTFVWEFKVFILKFLTIDYTCRISITDDEDHNSASVSRSCASVDVIHHEGGWNVLLSPPIPLPLVMSPPWSTS